MKPVKAEIHYQDKSKEHVTVMFNPEQMTCATSNNYADTKAPGDGKEKKQFVGKNTDTLTVTLFFDITRVNVAAINKALAEKADPSEAYIKSPSSKELEKKSVREVVKPIIEMSKIAKGAKTPPKLNFTWADYMFPCVILSIEQKYDYFDADGYAKRAELTVKFQRYEPEAQPAAGKAKDLVNNKVITEAMDHTCVCEEAPKEWREQELFKSGECDPMTFQGTNAVGNTVGKLLKGLFK